MKLNDSKDQENLIIRSNEYQLLSLIKTTIVRLGRIKIVKIG